MKVPTLKAFCAGKRVLFLDKGGSLRRIHLDGSSVHCLDPFVGDIGAYLRSFDVVLYTNPESSVNRSIASAAAAQGVDTIYCTDGFYEFANACFNPRIRRERPFGTFVSAPYVAVRTAAEAVFFSLMDKKLVLI